jgi:hypothetical protein
VGTNVGTLALAVLAGAPLEAVRAQDESVAEHRRGRLWESVWNMGLIGDLAAWDFGTPRPMGLFPGFDGFTHPIGGENNAIDTYANANMHNFRSGVFIGVKDLLVPGPPPDFRPGPKPYEVFAVGGQFDPYGTTNTRPPIALDSNYVEAEGFNPLLPEEWTEATWDTNVGITVTRRSYVWGFPGYSDFIVYDYTFTNTGRVVSGAVGQVVPNVEAFQQTLSEVYFAFHSALSVSTKSQINFHADLVGIAAGAFGWQPGSFHDFYHVSDDETLVCSYNYNGGAAPTPFDPFPIKDGEAWRQRFGDELQSPAAFGWLALYADPDDDDPDGAEGARPDVLRVDDHKQGTFQGSSFDMERFTVGSYGEERFYEFLTTPDRQGALGNTGNRLNIYTLSYGPYTMAPGESVRLVVAEIAGVMDYAAVNAGDPEGFFPDSTIAAIEANAALARNAVAWGLGATVDGFPLAADVPEPPPAPATDAVNASEGTERALIAVTWDAVAETAAITDGSGGVFYDGASDLDGYRIYRSTDFQFVSDTEPPVLRGAEWTLLREIPLSEAASFFNAELGRYRFVDESVEFGRRYGYYVAAVNADPRPWTSANGTVVTDLPELVSGSYNRSEAASAVAGPVESFDVYAVPNPYVFGDPARSFGGTGVLGEYTIEFRNLPERATIRIYTISGDLIRTLSHGPDSRGNLSGTVAWDQKSDAGLLVAPGLYVFHVDSETEGLDRQLTGKVMIIR